MYSSNRGGKFNKDRGPESFQFWDLKTRRNGVEVMIIPSKNKISWVATILGPEGKLKAADPIIPSTALIPPSPIAKPT